MGIELEFEAEGIVLTSDKWGPSGGTAKESDPMKREIKRKKERAADINLLHNLTLWVILITQVE